jgi:MoaA/NifB/PqqE/SkfB family radical SAM enzyme
MSNTNSGEYRVCCESFGFGPNIQTDDASEVWNSDYYKQLRIDLINGIQNKNCDSCWKVEQNGGHSMRKNENSHYSDDDIQEIISNVTNGHNRILPKLFDFKLGNLCNLKCIMCCQLSSSLHESEVRTWKSKNIKLPALLDYIEITYKNENQQYRIDKNNCDNILENLKSILPHLTTLQLVGGEPLINPFTFEIVDKLIQLGYAKNLKLDIITNLSVVDDLFIKKLEQFKSVQLTCSYDHVDPVKFHFIRYPANYTEFKHNFDKILKSDINVSISTTFSIFNIFDLEQILDEFEKLQLPISFNYVVDPNYFSIKYLDPDQKLKVIQIVDKVLKKDYNIFSKNTGLVTYLRDIEKLLYADQSDYEQVIAERTRVLALYDSTRKTTYNETYSE